MWRRILLTHTLACIITMSLATGSFGEDNCSSGIFNRQSCTEAKDGAITIGTERRRSTVESSVASSTNSEFSDAAIKAAFCADATANATAGGGAPQAVVDICRGFIPIPVGPGRDEVVQAFKELPLYKGMIQTAPRRATLVNFETHFWCGDDQGRTCTELGEAERRLTLLGQPVRILPKIITYSWFTDVPAGCTQPSQRLLGRPSRRIAATTDPLPTDRRRR